MSLEYVGNVRELKNIIERAVALSSGPLVGAEDIAHPGSAEPTNHTGERGKTLKQSIAAAERQAIMDALSDSNWVINRAASSLGISRKTLWEKMKRYEIDK